jgi:hypothetical protein
MARVTRGLDRADSSNLPYVFTFMMMGFMHAQRDFMSFPVRGVKAEW